MAQGAFIPAIEEEDTKDIRRLSRGTIFYRRQEGNFLGLIAVVGGLAFWQAVVQFGLVSARYLSPPSQVLVEAWQLFFVKGTIYSDLAVSGLEILVGFCLGILVGIPVGILMGRNKTVRLLLEPFVMMAYSTPAVAFLPLLIIWLGIGIWPKVFLIFVGSVFVMIINSEAGVRNVDQKLLETARSFLATNGQVMSKVVLPAALPFVVAGLRLSVGRVLIMMVVAEMYMSTKGIGYLIINAGNSYDTVDVFLGVLILALAGIILNRLAAGLERKLSPWV